MIRINEDYVILVDKDNYTLAKDRHKTGKNGNYKTLGFYMSLVSALEAFAEYSDRNVLSNGCMSLTEACTAIKKNHDELTETIKKAFPEIEVIEK